MPDAENAYTHCDGSPVQYVYVLTFIGEVEGVYSDEAAAKQCVAIEMGLTDPADVEWTAREGCQEAGDGGEWELTKAEVRHG